MKAIGLIGGMSWESTVPYYRILNETVRDRLGGLHSARLLLYSVDFAELERCQAAGDWDRCGEMMAEAASVLERAGAEGLVICANTMHKALPQIRARVRIPVLHIADATARRLREQRIDTAALLGTRYTMLQDFYKDRLAKFGIRVLIPDEADVETVNAVIYQELCLGILSQASRDTLLKIIGRLAARGAQGVILGCTELGMLIAQEDVDIPLFDTTRIHAEAAALWALGETAF